MRLMRLCTNPPPYLQQFYARHPHLAAQPYAVQYRALVTDRYGWSDYWTHALTQLGYEEVWEPVGNAEPAQKAWARERGLRYRRASWLAEIAAAQVKCFRPDAILVNDYSTYTTPFWRHLRSECPSLRLVLGWCGAPFSSQHASTFAEYDIVLSNLPTHVEIFRQQGHTSEYMRHAFDPRVLDGLDPSPAIATDFAFVGSIVKRDGFHQQREQLLKTLVERTEIQLWLKAPIASRRHRWHWTLKGRIYDIVNIARQHPGLRTGLERLPKLQHYVRTSERPSLEQEFIDPAIAERARPPLFGMAMYRQLAASRVSFNQHIDVAAARASNMRLFEATGVGSCLLTEGQSDLAEIFCPDTEVVTYRCVEEAIEKVRYLLDRDSERQKIARAGQQRTLSAHTFVQRAAQLDNLIKRSL